MLVSVKRAADFSTGCRGRELGHLLVATHPTLPFAGPEPLVRFKKSGPGCHCPRS